MKAVSLPTPLIADGRQLIDAARQRVALSSGMAASLIGMTRVQFLGELHRYDVPMIDLDENELAQDIANA